MTLIAAIPCEHGYVLAADSQETVTNADGDEYRRTVQKLNPQPMGSFQVVLGGSGTTSLIESFAVRLKKNLDKNPSIANIQEFIDFTEKELARFYSVDVDLYPGDDKDLRMFFAAVGNGKHGVWVQEHLSLRSVKKPELIGWNASQLDRAANG